MINEECAKKINKNVTVRPIVRQTACFGAYFLPDNTTSFSLFTFSDTRKVILEIKPYKKGIQQYEMQKETECIWNIVLPENTVLNGDRYRFIIYRNNEQIAVKDPCSMWQDSYFKWSRAYNHNLFNWSDDKWFNGLDNRRVSRLSDEINRLLPVDSLLIYELHIGTFTKEGTFLAAKNKLKRISELNFNAIEIMPLENTYSFNWGYDGVDKYAPNHTYGTPEELKELIDYAHELGLNVIMDIVPNHLGPDIAELPNTGPYIEGINCFGYKFNFEGNQYSSYVRDFIIGAALNWILNYHCDGLRVDMTKFMCSDFTMKQMVAEINYHAPMVFLIAEDGRDNDNRVTNKFTQAEYEENEFEHNKFIEKIKSNDVSLAALGFDSEWDFPFHKQIASSVLGHWDCYSKNLCDFDYALREAQTRVKYMMSHDEIGNIDGTRLISKILAKELGLDNVICECALDEKCKLSAHAAHRLSVAFMTGAYEKMSPDEQQEFCKKNNLTICISPESILAAYKNAIRKHKLALGKIYSIPGAKMVFQGDEEANIAYFKFFRKFSTGAEPYLRDKGYEPGISAFLDSKLDSIKVSEKYTFINEAMRSYVKDLNTLCQDNIALTSGHIEKTIVHVNSDTHAIFARKIYNQIFSVSNFSNIAYNGNYGIMFPKGKWKEILNSNDTKYAGDGNYMNKDITCEQFTYISLPAYGISFFEKI